MIRPSRIPDNYFARGYPAQTADLATISKQLDYLIRLIETLVERSSGVVESRT